MLRYQDLKLLCPTTQEWEGLTCLICFKLFTVSITNVGKDTCVSFFWILGTAVINAWCLYRRIMKQQGVPIAKQLDLLQFICSVSHSLAEATIRRKGRGRPSIEAPSVPTDKLPGKHLKWHHRQIFALILSTIGLFIGHILLAAFTVGNNLNGMWKVQKRPVCEKLLQRLP